MSANRNRAIRRYERCRERGHKWAPEMKHYNDPFNGSPHLPGGLVGVSKTCTRCGYHTGRGDY